MGELVHSSKFSEEDIRRGLLTLALCGGNSERASRELDERGAKIPARTLRFWKATAYPDLYREIHDTNGREIEQALVPEFRETAIAAAAAARKAVEKTVEQLDADQVKDAAGAARNLVVVAGTAMDKLYLATDRPTEADNGRDAAEILRALAARVGLPYVEGTAEDA